MKKKIKKEQLNFIPSLSLEEQKEQERIKKIQKDAGYFYIIDKPTEKVQLFAIKRHWRNIDHIQDPTEEMQLLAVNIDPRAIKYIKEPTEAVKTRCLSLLGYEMSPSKLTEQQQIELVNKEPYFIHLLSNPSEQVQLEAVKIDEYAIMYIKKPTEQVQLEAIKKDLATLKFIKKPAKTAIKLHDERLASFYRS